jgi:lipid-binding SYLF domain-containing protein
MMRRLMTLMLVCALAAPVAGFAESKEKKQQEVRKAAKNALSAVYKAQPSAKKAVESAAGYAAFSNFGMKILVAGSGTGKGMAVNNQTKAMTYMKMFEVQAGFGFGVKKFSLVWVFETEEALKQFVDSGWEIGAQATAAATTGEKGKAYQGAVAIAPGVWLYQVTDKGLALELTAKGTKYYKDADLN